MQINLYIPLDLPFLYSYMKCRLICSILYKISKYWQYIYYILREDYNTDAIYTTDQTWLISQSCLYVWFYTKANTIQYTRLSRHGETSSHWSGLPKVFLSDLWPSISFRLAVDPRWKILRKLTLDFLLPLLARWWEGEGVISTLL